MAAQFDDLSKTATGLLKDSFPFDRDGKARSIVLLKATAKSTNGTALTASFEHTKEDVGSVETNCKHGETDIKTTFSTKDAAISAAATRVVKGAKVGLAGKVSSKTVSFTPSVDYSSETVAFRAKVEVSEPLKKVAAKTEASIVVKRDKVAVGAQVKATNKEPTFVSLGLNYNTNYNLGLAGERKPEGDRLSAFSYSAFFNVFHQVADSKTKLALAGKVALPLAEPSIKGAILFPLNDDTTAGIYADSEFHLASSLRVKVNQNLSVAGSVYAPLSSFLGTADDNRVVGLSVEFSE